MSRKALLLLMVMLTVPTIASAANYWSISATTSPSSLYSAITRPTGAFSTAPGSTTTNVTSNTVTYADFTVATAPVGPAPASVVYTLSYVLIDGVKTLPLPAPAPANTYRVNKNNKINHSLSAVYATQKYTISTSKTGNGLIDPSVQVTSGSNKTINVVAGLGYTIASVTKADGSALDAAVTVTGDTQSRAYTFSNVTANQTIKANFTVVPSVDARISSPAQTIGVGASVNLWAASTSSVGAPTNSWATTSGALVSPTVSTPDGDYTTFTGNAVGNYTVTLTSSAGGASDTATVVISVVGQALVDSNGCIACHASRNPANVDGFVASKHATTASTGCQGCHVPVEVVFGNITTVNTMPIPNAATICATCHSSLPTPALHAAVQATCNECHNVHSLVVSAHNGGAVAPGHAQYVSSTVTCANCHAGGNTAIMAEYKESAHGNPAGEAWAHYDWRSASRAACQRCHNGTAFAAKLETLSDVTNFFGATPPVAAGETLNCSACHADITTGELRAASNQFTVPLSNDASIAYDVPGASALCVRCHGGRESGDSVKGSTGDFANLSFINSHYLAAGGMVYNKIGYEFAGQAYDTLGYHRNVGKDDAFGTGTNGPCVACHMSAGNGHTWDFVTKDDSGHITANNSTICVNCHAGLTSAALEAVKEDYEAALAALKTALAAKGILFNNAYPYFYKDLNGNGLYDAATEAGSSNAFKNWDGVDLNGAAAGGTGSGKDVMGAAFNYNLLEHDPGAWAHNKQYALKLIADSCDLLADGVIDGAGIPAAVTTAQNSKEFAEATSHPAPIVEASTSTNCAACHVPAPHYGGKAFHEAQYVSAASLPVSCADCHGESVNTTANQAILVQFAESAHADPAGEAWIHYDWRGANRSSCARCHTGTAFVAKLGIENDTTNVFQPGDILKPGEALACSACHTDAGTGTLRTAAQEFVQEFTINMKNGATVTYDVAGASTLCARCHAGRETGESIKADTDATGVRGFIDSHYQPAAGTLYNKAGYDYATPSWGSLGSHKLLGATGQGPCVTCHMSGKDHTLVAASCGTCHDGATAPVVNASNLKATYDAALNDLKLALEAKGIHYGPVHPFFFTAPYVAGSPNTPITNWGSAYGAEKWKDTMGAAFNYNLLWSEKGAYAHNYDYAMRLIADSIDFLSDGSVDGP